MNLVRHELGLSKTESRFPTKGTCLSIYSRGGELRDAAERGLARALSLGLRLGGAAEGSCLPAYVEAKQAQNVLDYDDLLLYWAQMVSDAGTGRGYRQPFRPCAGRRISGYQPAAVIRADGVEARRPRPDGRGRRCPVDLFVPGSDGAQHPRFSGRSSPAPADVITLDRNYRSTQPILAAANGVIDLARERFTKNLWTEQAVGGKRPKLRGGHGRSRPGALHRRAGSREPRDRHDA